MVIIWLMVVNNNLVGIMGILSLIFERLGFKDPRSGCAYLFRNDFFTLKTGNLKLLDPVAV